MVRYNTKTQTSAVKTTDSIKLNSSMGVDRELLLTIS